MEPNITCSVPICSSCCFWMKGAVLQQPFFKVPDANHAYIFTQCNVKCLMHSRWGTTYGWFAKFPLAVCLPSKISAYSCVKTGCYLPTVFEHQLSSYHNKNGYILRVRHRKKIEKKNVCSRPCYHHNYELCLQSDIWARVKCNSFCCTPFCSSSLAPLVATIVITCIVMWRSEWGCDRIELVKSLHYTGTCIATTMHAYIPSTPLDITEFYFVGQLSRGKGNFAALTKTSDLLAQIIYVTTSLFKSLSLLSFCFSSTLRSLNILDWFKSCR